jgi:hypothetical protein
MMRYLSLGRPEIITEALYEIAEREGGSSDVPVPSKKRKLEDDDLEDRGLE